MERRAKRQSSTETRCRSSRVVSLRKMGDRDGGGGAAESYARKRQYDYSAVRSVVSLLA